VTFRARLSENHLLWSPRAQGAAALESRNLHAVGFRRHQSRSSCAQKAKNEGWHDEDSVEHRADAEADLVVGAWQGSAWLVLLDDGGWAPLPTDWRGPAATARLDSHSVPRVLRTVPRWHRSLLHAARNPSNSQTS
jgi:hypothetical protein